jgi:hypothetical protein
MREVGVESQFGRQLLSWRFNVGVAKRLSPGLRLAPTLSKDQVTSGDDEPRPGIGGWDIREPAPSNCHRLGRDAVRIACAPTTRVCGYEVQARENLSEPGLDSVAIALVIPRHDPYCRFQPKSLQRAPRKFPGSTADAGFPRSASLRLTLREVARRQEAGGTWARAISPTERDLPVRPKRADDGNDRVQQPDGSFPRDSELDATPHQIALAWQLHRSTITLPSPGTTNLAHLTANIQAAAIELEPRDVEAVTALIPGPGSRRLGPCSGGER